MEKGGETQRNKGGGGGAENDDGVRMSVLTVSMCVTITERRSVVTDPPGIKSSRHTRHKSQKLT